MTERVETIDTIMNWHAETFPEATLQGQITKFIEEMNEFDVAHASAQEELCELADMVIVSAGISRFDKQFGKAFLQFAERIAQEVGYDTYELWQEVDYKMSINRQRVWSKTQEGTYHHISTGD